MDEGIRRPGAGGALSRPDVPKRTIASFTDYEDAQAAVDQLADAHFPVERVEIVGSGLRYVERVTGRYGYGKAALTGAINGAILGALLGWIFGLFDWARPLVAGLWLALWGALVGAAIGAVLSLIAHSMTGGRRDFSSIAGTRAEHYDIQADAAAADEASEILGTRGTHGDGWRGADERGGEQGGSRLRRMGEGGSGEGGASPSPHREGTLPPERGTNGGAHP